VQQTTKDWGCHFDPNHPVLTFDGRALFGAHRLPQLLRSHQGPNRLRALRGALIVSFATTNKHVSSQDPLGTMSRTRLLMITSANLDSPIDFTILRSSMACDATRDEAARRLWGLHNTHQHHMVAQHRTFNQCTPHKANPIPCRILKVHCEASFRQLFVSDSIQTSFHPIA
jgi:hypothetical protein